MMGTSSKRSVKDTPKTTHNASTEISFSPLFLRQLLMSFAEYRTELLVKEVMVALYYLAATDSRESYLANTQTNFAINNVTSLATRIAHGYYTLDMLPLTLLGIVGVLSGQALRPESRRQARRRAAAPARVPLCDPLQRHHRRAPAAQMNE